MKLEVLVKTIYGKERFYPMNDQAQLLCDLLKCKTLTKEQLFRCEESSWQVIVKQPDYELKK